MSPRPPERCQPRGSSARAANPTSMAIENPAAGSWGKSHPGPICQARTSSLRGTRSRNILHNPTSMSSWGPQSTPYEKSPLDRPRWILSLSSDPASRPAALAAWQRKPKIILAIRISREYVHAVHLHEAGAAIEAGDCANSCSGWVVCCLGSSRRDIRCEANRFIARRHLSASMKKAILDARSPEHAGR